MYKIQFKTMKSRIQIDKIQIYKTIQLRQMSHQDLKRTKFSLKTMNKAKKNAQNSIQDDKKPTIQINRNS